MIKENIMKKYSVYSPTINGVMFRTVISGSFHYHPYH